MPVRKIPIGRGSITGRFSRGPGGGSIGFESTLERDFVCLMLFDPAFAGIEEQPVKIPFCNKTGRRCAYTPDYLVERRGARPLLAEIKPKKFLTPKLEPKFAAARAFAQERGWTFEVWTEREIRVPQLAAIRFLLPYRHHAPDPGREARLLRRIEAEGPMTVEALLDACWADEEERAIGADALWRLVAVGELEADLGALPTTDTVLNGTRRKPWPND